MRKFAALVMSALLVLIAAPAAGAPTEGSLDLSVDRAPISPDGTTAHELTDFVLTFRDRDPAVAGISMHAGGSVTVQLPPDFTATGADGDTLILLQGWPQSPPAPPPAFPWTTTVDGNTVTATMTSDFLVSDFGPGFKQVHLLLPGFVNPAAGVYDIPVTITPDPASKRRFHGTATVEIIRKSLRSVNIVSVFSGPPGPPPPFFNPLHQAVATGNDARQVGMYLWDRGSSVKDGVINPLIGVDIIMTNATHGRLVQGTRTLGQVRIDAPPGASEFGLTTGGPSVLGTSAVSGLDTGVLIMTLHTDPDVTGTYEVALRLHRGNTQTMIVTAG